VITYHFKNKDEIVTAVLESALEEIIAGASTEAQKGSTVSEKIHAILSAMIHGFIDRMEAAQILISFWGRISKDENVAEMNAKLYADYRSQVARVLGRARKSGEIEASKAQISAIAALIVGVVIGVAMQYYFQPGAIDPDAVIEESARSISIRLGLN
jgi:AcrR family transcriptional regulator